MTIPPNNNLRIADTANGPAPDGSGTVMIGFAVIVSRSFAMAFRQP